MIGLYGIGTLQSARRRGVGSALTLVPMLAPRDEGYRAAILHATPEGERLYPRLGFREYCRISRFAGGLERESTAHADTRGLAAADT